MPRPPEAAQPPDLDAMRREFDRTASAQKETAEPRGGRRSGQRIIMSLHYLDESRAPRECPCSSYGAFPTQPECPRCNGTGRLGVEGAEPDIEVFTFTAVASPGQATFYWSTQRDGDPLVLDGVRGGGPFPTEAAALAAARAKHEENASG